MPTIDTDMTIVCFDRCQSHSAVYNRKMVIVDMCPL